MEPKKWMFGSGICFYLVWYLLILFFHFRTANLILYDFVVCIYVIFIIFFVVWTIIGFNWYSNEPNDSPCRTENSGIVMIAEMVNLICMVIYLIVGILAFLITLCYMACDEGR